MSVTTVTSSGSQSVSLTGAENAKITNLAVSTPNSETSHSLVSNLKKLVFRCRTSASLKFSFTSGDSGTNYVTVPKHCTAEFDGLDFTGKNLYVQSPEACTVEILELY